MCNVLQRLEDVERPRPPRQRNHFPDTHEVPSPSVTHTESMAHSSKATEDHFQNAESRLCNGSNPQHVVEDVSSTCIQLFKEDRQQIDEAIQLLQSYCALVAASRVPITKCPEGGRFLSAIAQSVDDHIEEVSGHEMAILFQCYGKLGTGVLKIKGVEVDMSAVISRMSIRAEALLCQMSPDDISRMMWGLGSLQFSHCDDLLEAMVYRAVPGIKRGEYRPKCIASLIWAMGKLGFSEGPMLLRALVREAKYHMREFSAHEITQLIWGISRVKFRSVTGLLIGLTTEITTRMDEFDTIDLINTAFCFSRLSFHIGEEYLDRVSARVFDLHSNITGTNVSKFLFACAVQGYRTEFLSQSVRSHFTSCFDEYHVRDIGNLLWSLAVIGDLDTEIFALGVNSMDHFSGNVDGDILAKIYQCVLHLRIIEKKSISEDTITAEFQDVCRQAWIQEQYQHSAKTTAVVISTLEEMGYSCEQSNQLEGGAFDVSTVSSTVGEMGVIVVSYPLQFYLNDRKRLLPTLEWFLKVYKSIGLKVLWLKEEEWNQVPLEARQNHLGKKLQQVFVS